ncbi:hypothetical protein KDAU_35110 [Dictyobacter aurantiacus]|uniref:Uncharacterized protein n=1 Tax=Dictyobacter aurantiacus TaxID=1936993 RepID=A0A401ZH59_9CHLR|nr:hypothetical protein KDAU_35110 [Dictyobacter aurantiacus]
MQQSGLVHSALLALAYACRPVGFDMVRANMIVCMGNIPYVNGAACTRPDCCVFEEGTAIYSPQSYAAYGYVFVFCPHFFSLLIFFNIIGAHLRLAARISVCIVPTKALLVNHPSLDAAAGKIVVYA